MALQFLNAADFDLALTLDSGQTFHWRSEGDGFVGTIAEVPIYVEQREESLRFEGGTPELLAHYFALDHPLANICASFPNDAVMNEARRYCRGLRILRQPKWECLATFICSSMKQVAHIRQMSDALRRRFGGERRIGDYVVHTFPEAQALADATEADLRECGLGYRAKNLHLTASRVTSGSAALTEWTALSDAMLREHLCDLPGVGAKVANCVMLFAFERLEAFPIDIWISRVLKERYFPRKRRLTEKQMRNFSHGYFGPHGGYAQQYLFHHARKTTLRKRSKGRGKTKIRTKASARA